MHGVTASRAEGADRYDVDTVVATVGEPGGGHDGEDDDGEVSAWLALADLTLSGG